MTTTNRIVNEKCHQLELENQQLNEKLKRLSGLNGVANKLVSELKAEIRKLQAKSDSQFDVDVAKTEVRKISVPCVPPTALILLQIYMCQTDQ